MRSGRISAKAERFTESVIRDMNRQAVAHGAVSLAQGFPDFACPPELKRAVAEAVDADINQYAITWGSKALRDAIAESTPRHFPGWGDIDPERHIIAFPDDIYEHLVFEGEHIPLSTLSGMAERTVSIHSMSKTYSVTGWRVGWAIAPADLSVGIRRV